MPYFEIYFPLERRWRNVPVEFRAATSCAMSWKRSEVACCLGFPHHGQGLTIVDLASGRAKPMAPSLGFGEDSCELSKNAWSPDSTRIVLSSGEAVVVIELASGKTVSIGEGKLPQFSPSGEWISYERRTGGYATGELMIVSSKREGGVGSSAIRAEDVTWSPVADYFSAVEVHRWLSYVLSIYRIEANGRVTKVRMLGSGSYLQRAFWMKVKDCPDLN